MAFLRRAAAARARRHEGSELVTDLVWPSRDDSVVAAASEGLGGPAGRRIRPGSSRVMAALLILTTLICALGLLAKQPCRAEA